jgi:hypothetical protein
MRIQHVLLAANLLVLPSNTPTGASPELRLISYRATDDVAASGAAISHRDTPEPPWSADPSLSTSELETLRWVAGRFSLVDLEVPDVEIAFHPSSEDCGWNDGRYRSDGHTRLVDICVPDHGTFASDLHRRRTLVHELAHAWDDVNLTDDDRSSLLSVVGGDAWYDTDVDWGARGAERFAETIVWGLYDQRRRPTKVDVPCADLHRAFVEITGHEPPGPLEPICDLSRTGRSLTPPTRPCPAPGNGADEARIDQRTRRQLSHEDHSSHGTTHHSAARCVDVRVRSGPHRRRRGGSKSQRISPRPSTPTTPTPHSSSSPMTPSSPTPSAFDNPTTGLGA